MLHLLTLLGSRVGPPHAMHHLLTLRRLDDHMFHTLLFFFYVKYYQHTRMCIQTRVRPTPCVFKSPLTFYRVQKHVQIAFRVF